MLPALAKIVPIDVMKRLHVCFLMMGLLVIISGGDKVLGAQMGPRGSLCPPAPLTLRAAVSFGLAHNPVLQAAQEDVLAAEQGVAAAQADFLPRVDTSYTYTHLSKTPYAKVNIENVYFGQFQTQETNINRWQLQLTQPIFTGFGLSARYEMAKLERTMSAQQLAATRLDIARNIQHVYFQILLAEKLLQVARDNIAQLQRHRHDAIEYHRQGLVPQNDVLKAEVALAEARQKEKIRAKQVVILRSQLKRLLGVDDACRLVLGEWKRTSGNDAIRPSAVSLQTLFLEATSNRPELRSLDAAVRQAEEGIRAVRSRLFPHVSFFGTYYQEGKDFFGNNNDFSTENNAAVGVKIDWNWFEGGKTQAQVSQWEYRHKALLKRRQDLVKQIRIEVRDAYEQLDVARVNLDTARKAVKQAKENLRITELQYRQQIVIFSEVLDAQVYLQQARTNYYQALYGFQLAKIDLQRAIGVLQLSD